MKWLAIALFAGGILGTIGYIIYFARHHGLQGYDCNTEAYKKQKAIPWWKRLG